MKQYNVNKIKRVIRNEHQCSDWFAMILAESIARAIDETVANINITELKQQEGPKEEKHESTGSGSDRAEPEVVG